MTLYTFGFWPILLSLVALAWASRTDRTTWWGALGQPEIGVAMLLLSAATLTALLRPAVGIRFVGLETTMLAIDLALFLALSFLGVSSGKWWVLCAAALQLISTTAHLARLTTPGMWRLGYQVMEEASSYPTLALLACGIWLRFRQKKTDAQSLGCSSSQGIL